MIQDTVAKPAVSGKCQGENGKRSYRNNLWLDIISGHLGKNTLANKSIDHVRAASALIWCEMPHLFAKCLTINILRKPAVIHCILLRDCQGETLDLIFRAHSQLHYSAQAPVLPHYHPSGNTCFGLLHLAKKEIVSERERQKKGSEVSQSSVIMESPAWPKPATRLIDSLRSETLSRLLRRHNSTRESCTLGCGQKHLIKVFARLLCIDIPQTFWLRLVLNQTIKLMQLIQSELHNIQTPGELKNSVLKG